MRIEDVDKNFSVETKIERPGIVFTGIENPAIKLYGVFKENGKYRRMPEAVAKSVSEGVYILHSCTSGGRIKFKTDSEYVIISVKMGTLCKMPHFAWTGSIGFDMYADNVYVESFIPPGTIVDGYENVIDFRDKKEREITINFPLYSEVVDIYIGLKEGSLLEPPSEYSIEKPVVYYGSSITQGACATRPGNFYPSIVSRRIDSDYISLGFSGNALAEDEMAEYVANLNMSAFVYDYDWNAPDTEHLRNTHSKMFKKIREKNPDLPVIMMTRPKIYLYWRRKDI